jgi:hypothetical protein
MEICSIETIANAFKAARIRYLVVGGLAINAHGYQRFTNDLDLVIALDPDNISCAMAALEEIDYQPVVPITAEEFSNPTNRRLWKNEKNMLVLKFWSKSHQRTPIDIFIEEPFEFDVEWKRAIHVPVSETTNMPVLCRESLIEMKIQSGREKDLLDVQMLRKLDSYR